MADWTQVLSRDMEMQGAIGHIRSASGLDDCQRLVDYGGGLGAWSWSHPNAVVYDIDADVLRIGEEFARTQGYTTRFVSDVNQVGSAEGMIVVGVQQLLSGRELHAMLSFAADHLEPEGLLLITVATPWMLFEWLIRLMRRYDGRRAQFAWAYRLLRGAALRRVGPGTPSFYCMRPSVLAAAAAEHGLVLERRLPSDCERMYLEAVGSDARLPWYAWLVFRR
jgi:hypothetical protein